MELLAVVVHLAHPSRIGVGAPAAVARYCVVRPPALPQRVNHLEVFVRQIVAVVMLDLCIETHGACSAVQIAGDDVPPDSATREMIQRRHATSEQKWWFIGEIAGHAQAEISGYVSHC